MTSRRHQVDDPIAITPVDIREVWPSESNDFTPWLADHVEVLGEHLGIGELSVKATEYPIPGGRLLDILAEDSDAARWAIENQYGEGDHDHFTRGLAYAVALKCRAIIIVAENHKEEFIAVADEWNRYSESYGKNGIRIFLVAIEAWSIGDSAPGFRFRLVAGPNEWKVAVGSGAAKSDSDIALEVARKQFWSQWLDSLNAKSPLFRKISARKGSYIDFASGACKYQIWVKADSCHIQLRIDSGDAVENQGIFEEIENSRTAIEQQFGDVLEWKSENHRACIIRYNVEGSPGLKTPEDERSNGVEKLVDTMISFHSALDPVIGQLT
ncbi:MAG: DUF4268 domain-containing protein [Acidimicrobiia bacterium]|nr:DUF4268 domain-containing protein [Acidimicrobiia bacterium]MYG71459.1 DUF4268 domain-containing protein [Acidimicrobiia bacterium]